MLLEHYSDGYKLKFGSEIEFHKQANFISMKVGDFEIKQENGKLNIGKSGETLMSIEPPTN